MFSVTANISITQVKPTCSTYRYLQGECQANEVHHHLFVGQLHAEKTQQSKERLIMLPAAALLLTAQVDVSVELLSVLWGGGQQEDVALELKYSCIYMNVKVYILKAKKANLFHEQVVLSGALVNFEL